MRMHTRQGRAAAVRSPPLPPPPACASRVQARVHLPDLSAPPLPPQVLPSACAAPGLASTAPPAHAQVSGRLRCVPAPAVPKPHRCRLLRLALVAVLWVGAAPLLAWAARSPASPAGGQRMNGASGRGKSRAVALLGPHPPLSSPLAVAVRRSVGPVACCAPPLRPQSAPPTPTSPCRATRRASAALPAE